jgi:hypothetical protein
MTLYALRLAALFLSVASAATAEIKFAGILVTTEKTMFRLKDDAAGTAAAWVQVGQTFGGYAILRFDERRDLLTLLKDGAQSEVRLKDSKVQPEASIEISGVATFDGDKSVDVSRATLIVGDENSFPLKEGVVCLITPTRLPDGNIRYRLAFERTEADGETERLSVLTIIQRPGDPLGLNLSSGKNPANEVRSSAVPPRNPSPPISPPPESEKAPRAQPLSKTKP